MYLLFRFACQASCQLSCSSTYCFAKAVSSKQAQLPYFETAAVDLAASSCTEVAAEELADNRKLPVPEPSWAVLAPSLPVPVPSRGADSTPPV